jgi:hypothetical protein
MKNTVEEKQYFAESQKVIQLVLDKEAKIEKQLKAKDRLQLVKEHLKTTKSPEEYEALKAEERDLEKRIRFNQLSESAIPEEHKKVIKKNVATEQLEVANKLNELKEELKSRVEYLGSDLLPLIKEIEKLEALKGIPKKIDALMNAQVGESVNIPVRYLLNVLGRSSDETLSNEAHKDLDKLIKTLNKIEVPVETKGLLDFLKRGKK